MSATAHTAWRFLLIFNIGNVYDDAAKDRITLDRMQHGLGDARLEPLCNFEVLMGIEQRLVNEFMMTPSAKITTMLLGVRENLWL